MFGPEFNGYIQSFEVVCRGMYHSTFQNWWANSGHLRRPPCAEIKPFENVYSYAFGKWNKSLAIKSRKIISKHFCLCWYYRIKLIISIHDVNSCFSVTPVTNVCATRPKLKYRPIIVPALFQLEITIRFVLLLCHATHPSTAEIKDNDGFFFHNHIKSITSNLDG